MHCGAPVAEGVRFCPHCGAALAPPPGQALTSWGFIDVFPLQNPLLSSGNGPGVTSVALLGICSVPPHQAGSLQDTCAEVLGSFRRSQALGANLARQLGQKYQQEERILLQMGHAAAAGFAQRSQIIASWGASMQQLQTQTFESIQAQNLRTGSGAIAALGGNTLEQDPTTGRVYSLPAGYGTYCLDATGGHAVMGAGVAPGRTGCATVLRPWP